jgi:Ca-activated chloride channel family protein
VAVTPEGYGEMELPEDRYDDLLLPPWSSDAQNLHTVGFDLLVEFPGRGAQVASPSHLLAARMGDEDSAYVQLANMDDLPNRDLVLDVKMEASEPKVFAGIDKDSQTQFIGVVPSTAFGKRPDTPMRVAFVVDRSGSMGGAPMEQAKKAIRACLGALRPEDQFGIVAFDDRTSVFAADLVPGTRENREKAAEFLSRVDARGGTELLEGLSAATRLFGEPGGDIFLLTDGEVFAGSEIMAGMHDRGFRIHCLGIGSASQDRFLALLARETGGVSRFMTPRERVDLAALELFASVGRPVATGVGCIVAGSTDARLSPAPADTVFAGTPLVVYGSCPADAECVLQLKFEGADGSGTLEYPIAAAPSDLAETLRLLRGARLITDLESQLSQAGTESGPKGKRSANRVRELLKKASQEYGLASQVMSLVAVVKREGDVEGELPKITVIPVGMPQDTDFAGYFAYSAPPASFDTLEWSGTVRLCRMATYSVRDVSSPPDLGIADLRAPASHESHARLASEDRLVELAALLEPDGGMPGDDLEERILASLLALLAFYGEGHDFNRGPFARHMERLATWLEQADRSMLSDEHRDIITRVLDAIDAKRAVHGFGAEIANKFILEDEMDAPAAWASLRKAFDQSAYGEL